MKIRNGFVSNSSSSSFVLVVPKELHEKVLSEINDEYVRAVVETIAQDKVVFGKDCYLFEDFNMQQCDPWEEFEVKNFDKEKFEEKLEEKGIGSWELFNVYCEAVSKSGEDHFSHEICIG